MQPHVARMAKLNASEIEAALTAVPEWSDNRSKAGRVIKRVFEFKDFPAAIKFVNQVAVLAEKAWHHPYIDIRWNKITLALTTHDQGGLTEKDFKLAAKFDQLK